MEEIVVIDVVVTLVYVKEAYAVVKKPDAAADAAGPSRAVAAVGEGVVGVEGKSFMNRHTDFGHEADQKLHMMQEKTDSMLILNLFLILR